MKKLITILLVLITISGYSQLNLFKKKKSQSDTPLYPRELIIPKRFTEIKIKYIDERNVLKEFDKEKVIEEFVLLLDSIREYQFGEDLPKLIHDNRLDSASEYHNVYLSNMKDPNDSISKSYVIGHTQVNSVDNCIYIGDNPIIPTSYDRIKKYCEWAVDPHGEVCLAGHSISSISRKGMTEKDIARNLLHGFYGSPKHMEFIKSKMYTLVGANLYTQQNGNNIFFWFTCEMGCTVIKTTHKSEWYYPGNPLGLTEFYDTYETIFN